MRPVRNLRALAVVAVAALGSMLGGISSASAATEVWLPDTWVWGAAGTSTAPAKHSIVETSVRWLGGDPACTSALNLDYTFAGTAYCTMSVRAHPYNGTLRFAWAGPQFSGSYIRGRWDW